MSIQKLIDQTHSYIMTAPKDLRGLYVVDHGDFRQVGRLIEMKEFSKAAEKINNMDTEPREQILLAIAEEFGNDFLVNKFGYEVA